MAADIVQETLRHAARNEPVTLYVISGIVITVFGIDKVAFWISKFKNRNGNGNYKNVECMTKISKLYDWHNKHDSDGTPLWYVPRSWQKTQMEIAKTLRDVSESQHKISDCLERLEDRIQK